ncbi:MAG: hypothetical protein LBH06_00985 [Rikenellaceae bacterium]|nr:hypothetical protein [Rikenellaceae bacterium]
MPGTMLIKSTDKKPIKEMVVANRYSHKWDDGCFGVYNFGVCHLYGATCRSSSWPYTVT